LFMHNAQLMNQSRLTPLIPPLIPINTNKLDINVQKRGGAFEVDTTTVPKGLSIEKTTGTHYEIKPTRPMKEDEFLDLMKQIQLKDKNKL
jgi:hypothetical protein